MASISKQPKGRKTVQFVGGDGKRRSVRLGKVNNKRAEEVKTRIEHLNSAKISGLPIDGDIANWVAKISDELAAKLARAGLIPSREAKAAEALGPFIASYIAEHGPTVKPATVITWKQCERLLLEHFDPATPLQSITEGHAVGWRTYLLKRHNSRRKQTLHKLSESTIRKRCACARQFFEHATRLRLVECNPFKSKRIPTSLPKPQQKEFVHPALAHKIMQQLPNWQLRLVFALARWGGVRVPSEPQQLTWADVDWAQMRLTVHSPKTEHHEGHEKRMIPIFDELYGPLQDAWDMAEEGQTHILPMLQGKSGAALRKPLLSAIEAAGGDVWPKLWVALRATRDTELRETYPVHVVEAWMGHEDRVAKRNYTQVTNEHYQRAAAKPGAECGAVAVQKPVQQPAAANGDESQRPTLTASSKRRYATARDSRQDSEHIYSGDDRTRTCTPFGTRS